MFHHPIYNKRQETGKDVGGPSSSSPNSAANCKYTFHVQSFNLLWKQVITYSCTPSIYCMILTSCIKFVVFIAFVFELFQPWLLCKIFFLNGIWLHSRGFCRGVVGMYLMQLTRYLLSSRPWMYAVMFL